jgi:hypothetical protein
MTAEKGILTIAHTEEKYIGQAISLAQSVRVHHSDISIAIATDAVRPELERWFDEVVEWNFKETGRLTAKLFMGQMSPFSKTLFIDADSLVVSPLHSVFELFEGRTFGVYGKYWGVPDWFEDIAKVRELTGKNQFAGFNGGIYYFENKKGREIFTDAKKLVHKYDELGIKRNNGNINEEPLISMSMAINEIEPTYDKEVDVMYAPAGREGPIEVDVIEGYCHFNKMGRVREPIIIHFASDDNMYPYIRNQLRLKEYFEHGEIGSISNLRVEIRARLHDFTNHFVPIWSQIIQNKIKQLWYE